MTKSKYALPVFLFVSALSINMNEAISKTKVEKNIQQDVEVIEMSELSDLVNLFKKLGYTSEAWAEGDREIPRITFDKVSEGWKTSSSHIPVKLKKQVFFRVMAPLVLIANENILKERQAVKTLTLDNEKLHLIAKKYKIINTLNDAVTEDKRQKLLEIVDILPPSLVLAQAAKESGWGTSRFTSEGNAFFGQWDFSGNGMIPKHQRKELGNYGLARFESPLGSVEGYLLNINTHKAYQKLRNLRANIRKEKRTLSGIELASTLDKYSEQGQAYIDGIISLIKYNNLQHVDEAYLSNKHLIKLVNKA